MSSVTRDDGWLRNQQPYTSSHPVVPPARPPQIGQLPQHNFASQDDLCMLANTMRQEFTLPKLDPITFNGDPKSYHLFMQGFDNVVGRYFMILQ